MIWLTAKVNHGYEDVKSVCEDPRVEYLLQWVGVLTHLHMQTSSPQQLDPMAPQMQLISRKKVSRPAMLEVP